MEKLDLEKFNPQKAELTKIVSEMKDLTIKGVDDKEGYLAVDTARKNLKAIRVKITKTGKDLRAEALSFQKAVIAKEKELVEIIEPTEKMLADQQEKIDNEKERIARMELLPSRKEKLATIGITEISDDEILIMDFNQFDEFYNNQKEIYLAEKEAKIKEAEEKRQAELAEQERKNKEEADRLAQEKRDAETRKKAEDEAREQAKKDIELAKAKSDQEAQERARIAKEEADRAIQAEKDRAEADKKKAIQDEKDKAEAEKQELIKKQEKEKQDLIDKQNKEREEEKFKRDTEEKERQDKIAEDNRKAKEEAEETERLAKANKYKDWLKKNAWTEETKDDFIIERSGDKFTMFKKVDEVVIK